MVTLDNLLEEEEELEAQSTEGCDDSSVVIKATPDSMNTDFEIMMKVYDRYSDHVESNITISSEHDKRFYESNFECISAFKAKSFRLKSCS